MARDFVLNSDHAALRLPLANPDTPMNLHRMLLERQAAGRPVTVGLVGAGKFGTMFLAQARLTAGLHVVAVADLDVARAARSWPWPIGRKSASARRAWTTR